MKLSRDQVKKVAKLANLPISEKDEEKYAKQLSAILDYIDKLNEVDTSNIEPTYNVTGKFNVTSQDVVSPSLPQEEALKNAKQKKAGFFITKGVFAEE